MSRCSIPGRSARRTMRSADSWMSTAGRPLAGFDVLLAALSRHGLLEQAVHAILDGHQVAKWIPARRRHPFLPVYPWRTPAGSCRRRFLAADDVELDFAPLRVPARPEARILRGGRPARTRRASGSITSRCNVRFKRRAPYSGS